jgi:hypothetical protein
MSAKKAKAPSRSERWLAAVAKAQEAFSGLDAIYSAIENAFADIANVREEYESWKDNLPENLASSVLGEKLEAVCEMDFSQDPRDMSVGDIESLLDEAAAADLPLGFGRD